MSRLLKLKRIEEVSVVDGGAGVGCEIVFAKRNEEVDVMHQSQRSVQSSRRARQAWRTSATTFNEVFKAAALDAFPLERTAGESMQKFMSTSLGAEMLRTGVSLPTPHEAAILKQVGKVPEVQAAQNAGIDDDSAPPDWQDHSDMKIAVARMRGVDPSLNEQAGRRDSRALDPPASRAARRRPGAGNLRTARRAIKVESPPHP